MPLKSPYFANPDLQRFIAGFDALIFDMNGLLIDDEPLQLGAYNEVLRDYSLQMSEHWWTSKCLGRKAGQFMREYLELHGHPASLFEQILPRKEAAYTRLLNAAGSTLVRPGVSDFLAYLRSQNVPIALATSAYRPTAKAILAAVDIDLPATFPIAAYGDEVREGKPSPEIFLKVKAQLSECQRFLVLEDSPPGLAAAKAAGMSVIAVPNRLTIQTDLSTADWILTGLTAHANALTIQ